MKSLNKYFLVSCFFVFAAMANSDLQECAILDQGPGIVDVDLAKKAADCYASVVKNDSSNADAYYGLGVSHYLIGFSTKNVLELKKSQEALKKAVELNPDHAQAKNQLMTTEGWIGMLGG